MRYYVIGKNGRIYGRYIDKQRAEDRINKLSKYYKNIRIITEEEFKRLRGVKDATNDTP